MDCKKAEEEGKLLIMSTGCTSLILVVKFSFKSYCQYLCHLVSLAKSLTEMSEEVMHYEGEDMTTGSKTLTACGRSLEAVVFFSYTQCI